MFCFTGRKNGFSDACRRFKKLGLEKNRMIATGVLENVFYVNLWSTLIILQGQECILETIFLFHLWCLLKSQIITAERQDSLERKENTMTAIHKEIGYFVLNLSWGNQCTQSTVLCHALGNICTNLGENTYFICATFCSYLLHHPSKMLCCSFTIDHMEWKAVRWIEQLDHFRVITWHS